MPELELWIGQESDAGLSRDLNEDYTAYLVPRDEAQRRRKGALFLVADGMGGRQGGEMASRKAVEQVMREYYADPSDDAADSLVRAFDIANRMVYDLAQADPARSGMGTTLVAAVIKGDPPQATIANVGDSRAYLLHGKRLNQITVDHSLVEEQVRAGVLTREQARRHPQRNVITRALGIKPRAEVDLFQVEMQKGDVLLLCTDGLSSELAERQIGHIIRSAPPHHAAARLVAQANAQGGRDNISVMVVQAGSTAQPSKQRNPRLARALIALAVACCLCATADVLLALQQGLVGNPIAAPQPAPIHYQGLTGDEMERLAGYLGYSNMLEMERQHPDQPDLAQAAVADLWPARRGVFLVGLARNWQCQAYEPKCTFRLKMTREKYQVECNPQLLDTGLTNLGGQYVRVFGYQEKEGEIVTAQIIDLGSKWWAWWLPPWKTIYRDGTSEKPVWVYGVADQGPYSPIKLEDYPALKRGNKILVRGKWLEGEFMTFEAEALFCLEEKWYVPVSGEPIPMPQPTVTLRPTDAATND